MIDLLRDISHDLLKKGEVIRGKDHSREEYE